MDIINITATNEVVLNGTTNAASLAVINSVSNDIILSSFNELIAAEVSITGRALSLDGTIQTTTFSSTSTGSTSIYGNLSATTSYISSYALLYIGNSAHISGGGTISSNGLIAYFYNIFLSYR